MRVVFAVKLLQTNHVEQMHAGAKFLTDPPTLFSGLCGSVKDYTVFSRALTENYILGFLS